MVGQFEEPAEGQHLERRFLPFLASSPFTVCCGFTLDFFRGQRPSRVNALASCCFQKLLRRKPGSWALVPTGEVPELDVDVWGLLDWPP